MQIIRRITCGSNHIACDILAEQQSNAVAGHQRAVVMLHASFIANLLLTHLHTCIYVYTSTYGDIYKNIQLYDTFKSCLCSCNLKFAHTRINLFMCVSVLWISYFCICYEILLSIKDQQHEQQQLCYNNTTECILSQHTYTSMDSFVHSP